MRENRTRPRPTDRMITVTRPVIACESFSGLGPLILGYTFLFVGIVDMSAQVGLIGGGGLGDFAVTYGSQRYNWAVVYITVATIIVIVQVGQFAGNRLARLALRR